MRLQAEGITHIGKFDVPTLKDYDDELRIVEMSIVSPPYLLDFGKAYVDRSPPYTQEQLDESMNNCQELFDSADWPEIEQVLLELKLMGIIYLDVKPANIRPR